MALGEQVLLKGQPLPKKEGLSGAFFWLSAFYFVYCARPEEWLPGLKFVPLAKITGLFAFAALVMSLAKAKRGLRDLPKEAFYLIVMTGLLVLAALTSPVWAGGSFLHTLDFSKVLVAWVLTFLLITTFGRLRRVIFIQAASVAVIAVVSILKGHNTSRLEGVLGGIYSNPNDLAFAIVLSLPFCLAFLLTAKSLPRKLIWAFAMLVMSAALFLTASRAGFIDLVVSGAVCLWHFAVKGRRLHLIAATALILSTLAVVVGGPLKDRFFAMSREGVENTFENRAYGSYEERKYLYFKALEGMERHPLLGVGPRCFSNYGGLWKEVHNAYLQIGVEGGIPVIILYLMFFWRGFANLKKLRRRRDLDIHTTLFVGALHSSLIGFIVGALFAPEAYQFFPYFAVAQTSVLVAIVKEQEAAAVLSSDLSRGPKRPVENYARNRRSSELTLVR